MNGKEIYIRHLNFGSFIKWNAYISISIGGILGLVFSIISLLGGNVNSTFNGRELTGIQEILFSLFAMPIFTLIFGTIQSLFLFLPLVLLLKITKGIRLKGKFEIVDFEIMEQVKIKTQNNNENEIEEDTFK